MNQHRPVPRLDLAPKLKRPLSLWNPLDYLRLLYWVFYFPQALRWYVDTFGSGYIFKGKINWRKRWELLRQNSVEHKLLQQGAIVTPVTTLLLSVILQQFGIPLAWMGVVFGMVFGIVYNVLFGVVFSMTPPDVGWSSELTAWLSSAFFLVVLGVFVGWVTPIIFVSVMSVMLGTVLGVGLSVASREGLILVLSLASGGKTPRWMFLIGLTWVFVGALSLWVLSSKFGEMPIFTKVVIGMVWIGVWFGVLGVPILRPENWLLSLPLTLQSPWNGHWHIPHVTLLPIPLLSSRLKNWLRRDWETGLHNANQLLAYTLQFLPVIQAVNQVLDETPTECIVSYVAWLTEPPCDWILVRFAANKARLDTPARVTAAGFCFLNQKQPKAAAKFFAIVRSLLYGEEMFTLAQTLAAFHDAKESATIATLQVPTFPQEPLLRPASWHALANLHHVVEDVQLVQRSVSRAARAFALNRALGELKNILDNANTLPQAERSLIVDIAQTWQKALLEVAGEVGEIAITKPVRNPYVVGDPVEGNLFVGREEVMRQLEELWIMGHQLQSTVLYGNRRMGKTSILKNAANSLGSKVKVAYVNLLEVGDAPLGVGEVLITISDAVSQVVNLPPPVDEEFLTLPLPTFRRYLEKVVGTLDETSLMIALDEFEKIEELIEVGKIPKDFLGFLRGLVQKSSKLGFTFAGLHTLEEMTADYFQPFFASVIPIHVGFQKRAATRQILANPDEDFPLDYKPEALDYIHTLTHGQPYLVQLVGFQLVRRYNDYVFEQGRSRNPIFTVEDVEAVINDSEFFKRGRYYFDGVWGQAARGADGQQAILRAIAPTLDGLTLDALAHCTGIDLVALPEALNTLKRHDVVDETQGRWRIIVELFRRWVLRL